MSEYDACVKGPLKLKGDSGIKKKKKKKDDKKILEQVTKTVESVEGEGKKPKNQFELTKAQIAFIKQQEKMQEERIKKKASMTHKQRVEEFNKHLDSLTEHFDIPKWKDPLEFREQIAEIICGVSNYFLYKQIR